MSVHKIKLPHRLVQLGDTFHTREGVLSVVAIDRGGRNAHCIVKAAGDEWSPFDSYELETLAKLHGLKEAEEAEPESKAAAE